MSKITVKSKSAKGFRRAGIQFTHDGVELDTSKLKKSDLEAIANEPNLVIVGDLESPAERKAREKSEAEAAEKAAAEAAEKAKAAEAEKAKAAGADKGKDAK